MMLEKKNFNNWLQQSTSIIYSIITSECDATELQRNLDKTQEWSTAQLLKLNLDKCKAMHIGNIELTIVWKLIPLLDLV